MGKKWIESDREKECEREREREGIDRERARKRGREGGREMEMKALNQVDVNLTRGEVTSWQMHHDGVQ